MVLISCTGQTNPLHAFERSIVTTVRIPYGRSLPCREISGPEGRAGAIMSFGVIHYLSRSRDEGVHPVTLE